MAKLSKHAYECPVCGTPKKDANHWCLVWFIGQTGQPEFSVRPWCEETARLDDDVYTVCGQAHAHNMLDRFFASIASPPAACPDPPATSESQPDRLSPDPAPDVASSSASLSATHSESPDPSGTPSAAGTSGAHAPSSSPEDPSAPDAQETDTRWRDDVQTVSESRGARLSGI